MRYVIHIGPPKTGTTYLQAAFCAAQDKMRQSGINYPHELWAPMKYFLHAELVKQLRFNDNRALADAFNVMNNSPYHTTLISCEAISGLPATALSRLRCLIGNSEVSIVFYARRWSDWFPSQWQQFIKQGASASLPAAYAKLINSADRDEAINHELVLNKFAAVFGREAIQVVSFSNLVDAQTDLAEHFFRKILQFDGDIDTTTDRQNASLSAFDTEIVRGLNALHVQKTGERTGRVWRKYRNISGKDTEPRDRLIEIMKTSVSNLRINDNAPTFERIFDATSAAYGDRLIGPGQEWFARKARDLEYVNQDYLLSPRAAAVVNKLYKVVADVTLAAMVWLSDIIDLVI